MDLKRIVEEELERKRAMKVVIALHAASHQATDSTFLTESRMGCSHLKAGNYYP